MTTINANRIQSIDFLRGLAMIIMALDHCRDFLHYGASIGERPLDLSTTTPFLFMTRWITHFCAPVFVFLSGTGIFLFSSKGKTKKQVAFFLFSRGLFLMLVEIFIIEPLWDFNFTIIYLQVIWAIGLSMVMLSVLQFLPFKILLFTGLIIVFGHNLLDKIIIDSPFWKSAFWSIIHRRHDYLINDHLLFIVQYPFLPWLGLMILGYSTGKLYRAEIKSEYRKKILRLTGISAIVLFILIRLVNHYGDTHHWQVQKTSLFTFLDFINTSKYPPSLLFILITIGPALILLSFVENISGTVSKKILVFGKAPFFYYVLHVFLIHSIAWLTFFVTGHSWSDLDFNHFREGSLPYGSGHPLWFVYVVWIAVVLILYFPCRWYSKYKATHKHWWLSYI
jgi:uncharacterized membrane protein